MRRFVNSNSRRESVRLILIFVWLAFTVSFALWWFKFSFEHLSLLQQLQPENIAHWQRQKRMVIWEGSAWLALLVTGGAALTLLVQKEKQRGRRIREFFASFSHDVKTSLASLRVQAESLADDLAGQDFPVLKRLVSDTVRLQLQLENSLFLASQDELTLYMEQVRLSELCERMREQWPGLRLENENEAVLHGDERALRTLFSNLIKNAVSHGQATEMRVKAEPGDRGRVYLRFKDNGQGFEGSATELGRLFHRPKSTSGSGVGLYICRLLVEKMGGRLDLHAGNHGFRVDVLLAGELK